MATEIDRQDNVTIGGEIDARDAIAEVAVSDISRSKDWCSRLFGKKGPDLEPFPGSVEIQGWRVLVPIVSEKIQPSS